MPTKLDFQERTLQFGTRQINYRLYRQNRKQLRIIVSPDLSVDVYVPEKAGEAELEAALRKKAARIASAIDRMTSYHPLPEPKRYISGETLVYLGRQYRLKVETGPCLPARLYGKHLVVQTPRKDDLSAVRRSVDEWYRKRARDILGRYLGKCYDIAKRHGVPEPKMTIRTMQKRWGSCSAAGRITLNIKLVQVPVQFIEYVIMHELCHLKRHDHSKEFYSLLTRCLPDWRKRKEALDQLAPG